MGAPSRHMQISLPSSLLLHFVRIQWASTLFFMSRIITIVQGMIISFIYDKIGFSASAKVSSNKTTAATLSESAEVTNNSSSPSRQHSASSPIENLNIHIWENNFLNSSFRFPIVFYRIYCFLHLLKQLLNYFSEWVNPLKKDTLCPWIKSLSIIDFVIRLGLCLTEWIKNDKILIFNHKKLVQLAPRFQGI